MIEIEQILEARPRDLGEITVGRVLPVVGRHSVGPFVFMDHMGPATTRLAVRPHPHIHLATVTYLFDGAIMHRDSLGSQQRIEPGAINWMNAGRGIVHSERSPETNHVHGLQLWVGLPEAHEDSEPSFVHHPEASLPSVDDAGAKIRVLVGNAFGASSPVRTQSPMFYVDLVLDAGAKVPLPSGYEERAAYVIDGDVSFGGHTLQPRHMAVFAPESQPVLVAESACRVVLLGGEPLGLRYIWWNFVSSKKQDIVEAAQAWREDRFPKIPGDDQEFIPVPDGPHFAV